MEPKIKLTKHPNPIGKMRFYLIHLDNPSDYVIVKRILISNFGIKISSEVNGIPWFLRADLQFGDDEFILYWDELLGVFMDGFDQLDDRNKHLEELAEQAIPFIESEWDNTRGKPIGWWLSQIPKMW